MQLLALYSVILPMDMAMSTIVERLKKHTGIEISGEKEVMRTVDGMKVIVQDGDANLIESPIEEVFASTCPMLFTILQCL